MKALEKDRNRRYETANGFAADVQRYLADEPVAAPAAERRLPAAEVRSAGTRAEAAAGAAIAVALVGGLVGTTWQAVRAEHEADRARDEEGKARTAQQAAKRNRDLAEVNLVRSYLRPVGYNEKEFDPAELYALSELAELSGAQLQASTVSGDVHGDLVEQAERAEDRLKLLCLGEAWATPRRPCARPAGRSGSSRRPSAPTRTAASRRWRSCPSDSGIWPRTSGSGSQRASWRWNSARPTCRRSRRR